MAEREVSTKELAETLKRNWPILKMTIGNHGNMLIVPYVLGAERQVLRYRSRYEKLINDRMDISHNYEILHEVSSLFEDLEVLAVFMRERGHHHKSHKLWAEVRHHVRHDLRDSKPTPRQQQQTADRAEYLELGNFSMAISYSNDEITVGKQVVAIAAVEEYLQWVRGILEADAPVLEAASGDLLG